MVRSTAAERGGNTLNGFNDFHLKSDSIQGQNLALTGLFAPGSLDSVFLLLAPGFHMVENDPFIKSQLASRNQLYGLMRCKFGHVTFANPDKRSPRSPPCGHLAGVAAGGSGPQHIYQKSTYLTQSTLGPFVLQIWSRNVRESERSKPSNSAVSIPRKCRCGWIETSALKSTYLTRSTLGPYVVRIWSRNVRKSERWIPRRYRCGWTGTSTRAPSLSASPPRQPSPPSSLLL